MPDAASPLENREFSQLLSETADLMEIAGEDPFRIRSYRKAVDVIGPYPERIAEILADPARKVTDIAGIGKGLAGVLQEIVARRSFQVRDELLAKYPPSALELLKIQGLGPKTIALLFEHFRITTVDELEQLCREHKLQTLPRMGAKMEEKVLRSIEQYRHHEGRYLQSFAWKMAYELRDLLQDVPGVDRIDVAGSLRRGQETVADLDLLVSGGDTQQVQDRFAAFHRVRDITRRDESVISAKLGLESMPVDVHTVSDGCHGATLLVLTGSKAHVSAVREQAQQKGYTLDLKGLWRDGQPVSCGTEEEVYQQLGLAFMPPELREAEVPLQPAGQPLPRLLELQDLRGDLHMHTHESDGRGSLEEMAAAARDLGYEYLAITDHSKALAMANGLNEERVVAFAEQVRQVNQRGLGIHVFSGLECDIRKDGSMDIAWDALAELDLVIGSVHSYMQMEKAEMTDRLLRALECPHLTFLAHPTGRVLLHRDPYHYDFPLVARTAAGRRVYMEVNSSPERLDLNAELLRQAKGLGCRFVVNTDAHHPVHLRQIRYGITMARRGGLQSEDVINTLPLAEFRETIRRGN